FGEMGLAAGKGEIDGVIFTGGTLKENVDKGFLKPPLVILDFERSSYFPSVPTTSEIVKLSPAQESFLRTFTAFAPGQVLWFPPEVPLDRVEFMRQAFEKIVAMESYVKESKTRWPFSPPPIDAKDYSAQMAKTLAVATPEKYDELQKLADKYIR
ncbi:MAG: hypothetical protein Q8P12_00670, partial [bacterium]|nr:hypothetical protein [bacterium]